MAKNTTTLLLLPGETSWEIWNMSQDGAASLLESYPVSLPSEIGKLPSGDLIQLFPVKAFTSLPLHVQTADSSLFADLAATHAERSGLRPDPFAGQLSDVFPIFVNSEDSSFLSIVLRSPRTEDLPQRSPKAFDISPRAFPVKGNSLSLWKELGQWAFAIHQEGKLLYCQATASSATSPDAAIIREIKIAIAQLGLQGIQAAPSHAVIWSSNPATDTATLARALSLQADLTPKPAPVLPSPISNLLPADVRAAQRDALKRRNTNVLIAALLILYFGTAAFFGYKLWETKSTTAKLLQRVNEIAPEGEAYAAHLSKWDELEHGIDLNFNTVDILNRVARSIPPNSGLRLRTADISPTEIRLIGEAPQPQAVNQFSLNLSKNNDLAAFEWQTPEPKQSNRGWEFVFTGATPTVAP